MLWIADFIAVILLADTYNIKAFRDFVNMMFHKKTAAGKKTSPCGNMGRLAGHFDRRLDNAEAASRLVAELVRELRKALDAADATLRLVLTEFRAI